MWVDFDVTGQQRIDFFTVGSVIMDIMDWFFGQRLSLKLMINLFFTNMHLFTLQDINWWTGVVWIIVIFLSAVWTLILTAPIHSIGEQVM